MDLQTVVVALMVVASCVYAANALLPRTVHVALLRAVLRLPLPAATVQWLNGKAVRAASCDCGGCDKAGTVSSGAVTGDQGSQEKIIFIRKRNP